MVSADQLLERFRARSVLAGREIFLRVPDAAALLDTAEKEGLAFLGIEAFEFDGLSVKARLDYIADFSPRQRYGDWDEYQPANVAGVRAFLAHVPDDLVVIPQLWTRQDFEVRHTRKGRQQGKD